MATKVTALDRINIMNNDDLFYIVYDVDGVPTSKGIIKEDVKKVLGIGNNNGTRVVSGGMVWIGGLTYESFDLTYEISGEQFVIPNGTQVTLETAPDIATFQRIDLIYGDDTGALGISKGVESATPTANTLSPTQIQLTLALLDTDATEPDDVSNRLVYGEDLGQPTEFDATESTSGARIDLASTTDPITSTVSIETLANLQKGDFIQLTHATATTIVNFGSISLKTKLKNFWHRASLHIGLTNDSNLVTNLVNLAFFLDTSDITNIQDVTLFKGDFGFTGNETEFNGIMFFAKVQSGGVLQFRLDEIYLQEDAGSTQPITIIASDVTIDASNFTTNLDSTITDVQKLADAVDVLTTAAGAVDFVSNVDTSTILGRVTAGNGNSEELTPVQVRTLINVEDGADVTDATNVNAAGAVMETDYDANTILAATTDNTPVALTVGEQTFVGRITGGNITALTLTQTKTALKDRLLENASVTGSYDLDYSSYELWNLTLTGVTTFTESNLQEKCIIIRCTGNFALTFPANWTTDITGVYNGSSQNIIVVQYFKSGVYKVQITQPN